MYKCPSLLYISIIHKSLLVCRSLLPSCTNTANICHSQTAHKFITICSPHHPQMQHALLIPSIPSIHKYDMYKFGTVCSSPIHNGTLCSSPPSTKAMQFFPSFVHASPPSTNAKQIFPSPTHVQIRRLFDPSTKTMQIFPSPGHVQIWRLVVPPIHKNTANFSFICSCTNPDPSTKAVQIFPSLAHVQIWRLVIPPSTKTMANFSFTWSCTNPAARCYNFYN